ncbi:MAG: hypothetical protein R3311_10440, partial [Oceanisphaera sp.]|nr:hypothetical protein [Oceanisphaera sp.]
VLGYPVLAVQFAGWLLLLIPALYLGSWLLWLVAPLLMAVLRLAHFVLARLSGRTGRSTSMKNGRIKQRVQYR